MKSVLDKAKILCVAIQSDDKKMVDKVLRDKNLADIFKQNVAFFPRAVRRPEGVLDREWHHTTALSLALWEKKIWAVERLLDHGADPIQSIAFAGSNTGLSLMTQWAFEEQNNPDVMALLGRMINCTEKVLDQDPAPSISDQIRQKCLHASVMVGAPSISKSPPLSRLDWFINVLAIHRTEQEKSAIIASLPDPATAPSRRPKM